MEKQNNTLLLKFDGERLKEGIIDIYDLASTIFALGNTIQSISNIAGYTKDQRLKVDVSALRPGSFEVEIIVNFEPIKEAIFAAVAIAPGISPTAIIPAAKNILLILRDLVKLKKFLGGKKPKDVKINAVGTNPQVTVYNFKGDNMTINMPVYNAAQDRSINKNIYEIYKPLVKEDGNIDEIELKIINDEKLESKEEIGSVSKSEVTYFEDTSELQIMKNYRLKAIVSRLDSKTGTGYLTIGSKRITFELGGIDPNFYDEFFLILAESLKLKLSIFITGEAVLDFESNLKKIKITKVESEAKLF